MPPAIPPAERLLNLVIALVNTPVRMTKEQVRASVAGYGDARSDEAFERMFERDKDTLRELGMPVLTVTHAGHGDDVGYRIDTAHWSMPPIELTAAELGVLALAAQVWQDQSLRADSTRALTKLRAVGTQAQAHDLVAGLAPRVRAGGDAFGPLVDAVQNRQAVRFTYHAATTGEVRERTVEPWKLLARRGGWVLLARDRDRGASRSFRLRRIRGSVRPVGAPGGFEAPTVQELADASHAWVGEGPERTALLAVTPQRAGALRARASGPAVGVDLPAGAAQVLQGRDLVAVPYRLGWELAEEVVRYGDAVVVLDPPEVRDAVVRMLRVAATLDRLRRADDTPDVRVADSEEARGA
ncbi:transcriptional regulator protein-like protein [Cellulomonas flavigena DSM 20109]|uniref:Transcriptional regulator protein-like protein n=1 Tax=Cellulomonas flavigena (strain ATCC 482 / DSM 20109 / BCRC 11376 / JCM 18109 / NBRC 3775 / NCIMB 8073 / NRS 134) TaxID=446466 RepID=D5UEV3_CELFN|nr:WYL domain-containing protein [Cellulomonas flavigena]ADG74763.1 transcriptional regulator protein-like protein [Cellulomonas flavigena DSM 20109]